jgi:hypothetical protein
MVRREKGVILAVSQLGWKEDGPSFPLEVGLKVPLYHPDQHEK